MSNSATEASPRLPVFGHLAPDTDAITSAMVYAHLLEQLGTPATPYRLGELNNETKHVLEQLGLEAPPLLQSLPAGSAVALVDHNESSQSIGGLSELNVTHVIDHHKLGDLSTHAPAFLRFEPVGCTATILFKLFAEQHVKVEQREAYLMLSAILSDTLHFRSPTTTNADREAVEQLAPLAQIDDVASYAMSLFAAKSDLGDIAAEKLLKMDYKVFSFAVGEDQAQQWGIGVIETTNPNYVFGRKAELLAAMQATKEADQLGGVLLSVVDILSEKNTTLVLGPTEEAVLQAAFGVSTHEQYADLGNRLSRKKQVVPVLQSYFEGLSRG